MNDKEFIDFLDSWSTTLVTNRDVVYRNVQRDVDKVAKIRDLSSILAEAKIIIDGEILSIQKTLKEDIDTLVTIAINIVYEGRDIEFAFIFDKAPSGASTYRPVILENGEEFDPKDEQCGGVLDVISYALRPILHSLEVEDSRPFMWSDEPFKFLGGGILGRKAADMRKKINQDLGIQEVVIAHDDETIFTADYIYHVTHDGKRSNVKRVFPAPAPRKIKRIRGTS